MRYFSVAYRPLAWPLPRFVEAVSISPVDEGVQDLGAHAPQWVGTDPQLGEYATLFALRRVLEEEPAASPDEMVGISHYRRFAVTLPARVSSRRGEAIKPADFAKLSRDRFLPPPGTILHPEPFPVPPSLVAQYGRFHPVRDLLRFMALAIELQVVEDHEVAAWLGGDVLVPAASVGVFPRSWWIATMTDLERVASAFLETAAEPREGYNRRAPAFCLERLHSLLLVKLVQGWPPDRVLAHPELVVDPTGRYQGNSGA
ncbi:hypothetical protein [Klenkia brasiliensis]|uniref:Uncharacterized protein n=1 Tax=Klenkia brasiliensis TaxID=333142 RepID=A0A1G7LEV6_9ACTN|nr:hypothetical protein [Klenkia brasiliensis]SDF48018.1 hypothetical protein SAMN05660324_0238 [Klenkia brasiliensis]